MRLQSLANEIALDKRNNKQNSQYKGTLIFVNHFTPEEQRIFLSAADVQAQISARSTGAAEFTEADATANAALQIAAAWIEGITQLHGVVLDRSKPGSGNVIVPFANTEEAFRRVFAWLIDMYQREPEKFARYQAASVRLSRVVEARRTSSVYLRELHILAGNENQFSRTLEERDDLMTEAGLKLGPVYIESAQPALNGSRRLDTKEKTLDVQVVLRVAPGTDLPEVIAHTNAFSD